MSDREDGMTILESALIVEATAVIDAKATISGFVSATAIAALAHWSPVRTWWIDAVAIVWVTTRFWCACMRSRDVFVAKANREQIEALTGDES